MVSKKDLRLGNVFEQGIVCKINGRAGAKVHLHGKLRYDKRIKVIESVDVSDLKPIALTSQILVEWCGYKKIDSSYELDGNLINDMETDVFMFYISWDGGWAEIREITYLHELQNLYYMLNGKELEIRE